MEAQVPQITGGPFLSPPLPPTPTPPPPLKEVGFCLYKTHHAKDVLNLGDDLAVHRRASSADKKSSGWINHSTKRAAVGSIRILPTCCLVFRRRDKQFRGQGKQHPLLPAKRQSECNTMVNPCDLEVSVGKKHTASVSESSPMDGQLRTSKRRPTRIVAFDLDSLKTRATIMPTNKTPATTTA